MFVGQQLFKLPPRPIWDPFFMAWPGSKKFVWIHTEKPFGEASGVHSNMDHIYIYIWGIICVFPKIGVPLKSSILIGFSIINHPFWGIPIFGNTHIKFGINMRENRSIMVIKYGEHHIIRVQI